MAATLNRPVLNISVLVLAMLLFFLVVDQVYRDDAFATLTIAFQKSDSKLYNENATDNEEILKKYSTPPCAIGIASSTSLLDTLSRAAIETWVPDIAGVCDVFFFVGNVNLTREQETTFKKSVVFLEIPDDLPENAKLHGMISFFSSQQPDYQWYVILSPDTYVNVEVFTKLLGVLGDQQNGYLGMTGFEKPPKNHSKRPACRGPGYLIGSETLSAIGPHMSTCGPRDSTLWDENDLANCIARHALLSCTYPPVHFSILGYQIKDGRIIMTNSTSDDAEKATTSIVPTANHFQSALIHPLPTRWHIHSFHSQITHYMRPIIPNIFNTETCTDVPWKFCREVAKDYLTSCVHNPSVQLQRSDVYINECLSPPAEEPVSIDIPTFVLSLSNDEAEKRFESLRYLLNRHGLSNVIRFPATDGRKVLLPSNGTRKAGELGYLDTMHRIFLQARASLLRRILIFDDDVMPHREFGEKLKTMMEDQRCGGHLYSVRKGGVLLLGATIYNNGTYPKYNARYMGGWAMADADVRNHTMPGQPSTCFNANINVVGSFAVMYHETTYNSILDWLEESEGAMPYDWIFSNLAERGHIVRVAYPNLVVPDIGHVSSTDPDRNSTLDVGERAKLHRWNFENYCGSEDDC